MASELMKLYLGGDDAKASDTKDVKATPSLMDMYLGGSDTPKVEKPTDKTVLQKVGHGLSQGFNSVIDSVASGIGAIDKAVIPGGTARNEDFTKRKNERREAFEKDYGESDIAQGAKLVGQTLTTLPLVPMKVVQGVSAAANALPVLGRPIVNRLLGSAASGGLVGGEFGALTSADNKKSLSGNIAEGAITGAALSPVLSEVVLPAAQKFVAGAKQLWANYNINKIATASNLDAASAKNIVERLADAGLTPQQAQIELNKLGPKATIADLDEALRTEAGGLAARGTKSTSILKGRFGERALEANDEAAKIFEQKLGGKPDLDIAKERILENAKLQTSEDYKLAKANKSELDIKDVVKHIDSELESAVGSEKNLLLKVKSYLYKSVKNPEGDTVSVLKNNVKDLHKVREGIDDLLEKAANPINSQGGNALRALEKVRGLVDTELKTIPEMASADEKFAAHMKAKDALLAGYNVLKDKAPIAKFLRDLNAMSPELQAQYKVGAHAAIGDSLDAASRGELIEAQRLFAKNSRNREKIKALFGQNGEEVLDALAKEASLRNTEHSVLLSAKTAERQAVIDRYSKHQETSAVKEGAKGLLLDVVGGTIGVAAAISTSRQAIGNKLVKISADRLNRVAEGSADLLSRSGAERDNALSILSRVNAARPNTPNVLPKLKLPVLLPNAFGKTLQLGNSKSE